MAAGESQRSQPQSPNYPNYYRNQPTPSYSETPRNNDAGIWVQGGLQAAGAIIQGIERAEQNNQSNQNHYYREPSNYSRNTYPQNYQRNYNYSQPAPTYTPQVVTPVKAKANVKPPEVAKPALDNQKPGFNLDAMDENERRMAGGVVQEKALRELDELGKTLEPASNTNPEIRALLDQAKADIEAGKSLDPQFPEKLRTAVSNVPITDLKINYDYKQSEAALQDVVTLAEVSEMLQAPMPIDGGMPVLTDDMSLVGMPYWPEGEMAVCGDGSVMMGTGGGEITVATVSAADVLGMPVGVGDPEPDANFDFSKRVKSGILLMNPKANGVAISYVIGNSTYDMQPGFTQQLKEGQTWEVRFDRGEGLGEARYTLRDGTYAFGPAEKGWELYRQSFGVTIDNSGNEGPFLLNIDNRQEEIAPGEKETFASTYPILVRFDRGDGGKEAKKKVTQKNRTLVVSVSPKDGLWDLYPQRKGDSATLVSTAEKAAAAPATSGRAARLKALLQASMKK